MRKFGFELDKDWKAENGNINTLPLQVLLFVVRQMPPKSFLALRLTCHAFKTLADHAYFMWEPVAVHPDNARTLAFNFGQPQPEVGGQYYLGSQVGEYRWPAGQLLLCRDQDNAIETKSLVLAADDSVDCQFTGVLKGHESKITILKPLSPTLFASGDESGRVFVWTDPGFELTTVEKHSTEISAITRLDNQLILTADTSGELKCWSFSGNFLWKVKLPCHIVSLEVLTDGEVEVVTMDTESRNFHVTIHSLSNGEKLQDVMGIPFGLGFGRHKLQNFSSFFGGSKVEFRMEVIGPDEENDEYGIGRSRIIVVHDERGHTQFAPDENPEDFINNKASVFSNGNILFWKNDGNAKLVFHRRLPLTFGEDLPQESLNEESEQIKESGDSDMRELGM